MANYFWDFASGGVPAALTERTNGNGSVSVTGGKLVLDTGGSGAADCAAVSYGTAIDLTKMTVVAFSCSVTGPNMGSYSMSICGLYDDTAVPAIMSNTNRQSKEVIWLEDQLSSSTDYERWMIKFRNPSSTVYQGRTDETWSSSFGITIRKMIRDVPFVVVMVIDGPNDRVRWDFLNKVIGDVNGQGYRLVYSSEWADFGTATGNIDEVNNTAYLVLGDLVNDKSAGYDIQYEYDWLAIGEVDTSDNDHLAWANVSLNTTDTYPYDYNIYAYVNPWPDDLMLWTSAERLDTTEASIGRGSNDWVKDPCVYDNTAQDSKYYMAYQIKASGGDGSIYIAEASSPLGPWSNHTQVVSTGTGEAKCEFPYLTRKSATGDWVLFYGIEYDSGPTWKIHVRTTSSSTPYTSWSTATEILDTTGSATFDDEGCTGPVPIWWSGTFDAGTWILYYSGAEINGTTVWKSHYAVSTTGFDGTYTKGSGGPQMGLIDTFSSQVNGATTESKTVTLDSTTGLVVGQILLYDYDEAMPVVSVDSSTQITIPIKMSVRDNTYVVAPTSKSVSVRGLRKIGGTWHAFVTNSKFNAGETMTDEQNFVLVDTTDSADPRDATWREMRTTDTPYLFTHPLPLPYDARAAENIGFVQGVPVTAAPGTTYEMAATLAAVTTTSVDGGLAVLQSKSATLAVQTSTPDNAPLAVLRELTATLTAVTVTPDDASLVALIEMAATLSASTVTPDSINLAILRSLAASLAAQTTTPDAVGLTVLRELAATLTAVTTTPDDATLSLAAVLELAATLAAQTTTPDGVELAVLRELAVTLAASTTTPDDASLLVLRELAATLAAITATPDNATLALTAVIELAATLAAVSTTPDAVSLLVTRELAVTLAAVTTTPDSVSLAVLRELAAVLAAVSTTPDGATLSISGIIELAVTMAAVTTTPDTATLAVAREWAVILAAVSTTPDDAMLSRLFGLSATLAVQTTTPDAVALPVLREMTAELAAITATPDDGALGLALELSATLAAVTTTPDTATLITALIQGIVTILATGARPSVSATGAGPSIGGSGAGPSLTVE